MTDEERDEIHSAFGEFEKRILYYAHLRGAKHRNALVLRGHDGGELEATALVNAAWARLLAGEPVWDPAEKSLFLYFCHEIRNIIRAMEQKVTGLHEAIVSPDEWQERIPGAATISVDELSLESMTFLLRGLDLRHVLRRIGKENPRLEQLARCILQGLSREEQAGKLEISLAQLGRWKRRLIALIERCREEGDPDSGGARESGPKS